MHQPSALQHERFGARGDGAREAETKRKKLKRGSCFTAGHGQISSTQMGGAPAVLFAFLFSTQKSLGEMPPETLEQWHTRKKGPAGSKAEDTHRCMTPLA